MVWSINCHLIRVWLRKFQSFRKTIAILRSETETGLLNLTRQQQLLPLLQPTKAIIMPISNGGRRGANRLSGDALTRPTAKGFMGGNTNVSIVIMQILRQRGKQSRKELGGKLSWWASFARLLQPQFRQQFQEAALGRGSSPPGRYWEGRQKRGRRQQNAQQRRPHLANL